MVPAGLLFFYQCVFILSRICCCCCCLHCCSEVLPWCTMCRFQCPPASPHSTSLAFGGLLQATDASPSGTSNILIYSPLSSFPSLYFLCLCLFGLYSRTDYLTFISNACVEFLNFCSNIFSF